MPKETFLNLSTEKKQKIIEVLLKNFTALHISQVKVSDIVEDMGMSRGAFYKYFNDLEDAYTFTIHHYSIQIHQDILMFISQNKKDFFRGIENYLAWCSSLAHENSYWHSIKFLTRSDDLNTHKRIKLSSDSPMLKEWLHLLTLNHLSMRTKEEAISFLYFVMDLVINSLTDYMANEWTTQQLVQDFQYKRRWLESGLKQQKNQ